VASGEHRPNPTEKANSERNRLQIYWPQIRNASLRSLLSARSAVEKDGARGHRPVADRVPRPGAPEPIGHRRGRQARLNPCWRLILSTDAPGWSLGHTPAARGHPTCCMDD
jgi:hypothetical protein